MGTTISFNPPNNLTRQELWLPPLLRCMSVHIQLCPTLCNRMVCRPPGFSFHGISQARILEWAAVLPSSRGSSWARNQTRVSCVSCFGSQILYHCPTWEAPKRRGQLRMRWLDSIIDSMAMSLSKLWKTVENRGVCLAAVHRVTKSQIWLNSWTTAFTDGKNEAQGITDHVLSEVKQLVEQGFDSRQTLEPECSNPKLYFIVYINFYNKISL